MAEQQIEKRRLEENLGLKRDDVVQSGFDEEIVDIVLDLVNKKYESLREHPLVAQDRRAWPDWVFFLVIHEGNAQIWAIDQRHLKTVHMTNQDYLTPYDVRKCLKPDSIIHRFYVDDDDDRYYVRTNQLNKDQAEFDDCLYVGTLHLSLRGIKGIMAMIARENYLLLQTNCSGFCKNFVMIYFDMKEKTLAAEHVMRLETFLAKIEQSEQNPRSDWSSLSGITSEVWTFAYDVGTTVVGGIALYGIYRAVQKYSNFKL